MSRALESIAPGDTLLDAARAMSVKHIHRLPVVSSEGRLVGMLTSLDIVAALISAVEE